MVQMVMIRKKLERWPERLRDGEGGGKHQVGHTSGTNSGTRPGHKEAGGYWGKRKVVGPRAA